MKSLKEHMFLIGFMGVGKTSVSRLVARRLGAAQIDTDALIAQKEGMTIPEIFEKKGEPYFRDAETRLLDEISVMAPCVASCGGGMAMRPENVKKMKESGKIWLLTASPETIYAHVKDGRNRPLLNGHMNVEYIKKLMDERNPKYEAAADAVIETDGLAVAEVADKIIEML